jgi:NAD(P)-dependent dehydrogenase (short-subunit alcohol dehydrogenase family)
MRNFTGVLNVAKIAPKYIHSSLTITGGTSSRRPFKEWSALAPIAGAMPSLVRALSVDLAPLRVNVITPGLVDSEMWDVSKPHMIERSIQQMRCVGHRRRDTQGDP